LMDEEMKKKKKLLQQANYGPATQTLFPSLSSGLGNSYNI